MIAITLRVNGESRQVTVEPTEMLLEVLRDRLGYVGANKACGQGICRAVRFLHAGLPDDRPGPSRRESATDPR
jgi:aerobic-type carbon monoxide dehydrogenase small subunit (CoxS/CutS family)